MDSVVRLSILDGYKVRWSRQTVARDVVQNFFDESPEFDDVKIVVDRAKKTLRVAGPSSFDMDYLRYLGATTKRTRRAAGGFGEGFKVCALVLLRDYRVGLRAGSGRWEIVPRLERVRLGRELVYDVTTRPARAALRGSFVEIEGADDELCAAFEQVRDLFRHAKNARLAKPIWEDAASGCGIYESIDRLRGDVFYRRQHRGLVKFPRGNAVTFACDEPIDGLPADRDRRDLRKPQKLVAAVLALAPDDALEKVIRRLRPYWAVGSGALRAALAEATRRKLRFAFSERWVADVRREHGLQKHAKRRGLLVARASFASVGMKTLTQRFGTVDRPRPPTPLERARIRVAVALYAHLTGDGPPLAALRVRDSAHEAFRRATAVATAKSLAAPFEEGVAEVLAALARKGSDDEATNADRLTALLAGVAREAGALGDFARRWRDAKPWDAPLEGEASLESDESFGRVSHWVAVAILAPPGLPVIDRIEKLVHERAAQRRIGAVVRTIAVRGRDDAVRTYARGVPSVWIDSDEVDPPGGAPRYEVRTFPGPMGPSLVPSAELIDALLVPRARRRATRGTRARLGERAFERLLRAERPLDYQKHLVQKAIDEAPLDGDLPYCATKGARTRAAAGAQSTGSLEDAVRALANAAAEVTRIVADVGRAGAALEDAARARITDPAIEYACELYEAGRPAEEATAAGVSRVAALADVWRAANEAALDPACTLACFSDAVAYLDEGGVLERLEHDVAVARARHEALGAEACSGLGDALMAPATSDPEADPDEAAVRAAWDDALARGRDEVEAARAALVAAEERKSLRPMADDR